MFIDALHDRAERYIDLADNAVVIFSQADREEANADEIAEQFRQLVPTVVTIPYDRAIRPLWKQWDLLAEPTQNAYMQATAADAERL